MLDFAYSDGVFALSESVPQLDGLVSRARHDLTIVGREGNAEHVSFVVVELSSGLSSINSFLINNE